MDTLLGGVWLIAFGYCLFGNVIDKAYSLYERLIGRSYGDIHTGGVE